MPNRNSKKSGILTPLMLNFVAAWQGNALAAARSAGYRTPKAAAEKLMKNEAVQAAIKEKQIAMSQESGKLLARELKFCRNDILNRMWELANLPHEEKDKPTFETQLKALQALTDVFDNGLARTAELARLMEGRSPEEIEYLTMHGHFPGENPNDQKSEKR